MPLTTEIIKDWIEENFEEYFTKLKRTKKKKNNEGRIERTFDCYMCDESVAQVVVVSDYSDEEIYEVRHQNLTRKPEKKKEKIKKIKQEVNDWRSYVIITRIIIID